MYRLLLAITFFLFFTNANAQFSHAGRHFFFTRFGGGFTSSVTPGIYQFIISSKHHANVQVNYTNTSFSNPAQINLSVAPGEVIHYEPTWQSMNAMSIAASEMVENKSIEFISDSDITIVSVYRVHHQDDATEMIPVDQRKAPKARRYMLTGYSDTEPVVVGCNYCIVSSCDSTLLLITPAAQTSKSPANVPFLVRLNKGETFKIESKGGITGSTDLTGTTVDVIYAKVDVPISIYCGTPSRYVNMTYNYPYSCCADQLYEQLLPVDWWDTTVAITPYLWAPKVRIRVTSSANNNQLYLDNVLAGTLSAGSYLDTIIDHPVVFHTTKPSAFTMFMFSSGYFAIQNFPMILPPMASGDPDMLWCLPAAQGITDAYFRLTSPYSFVIGASAGYHNGVVITSPTSNVNDIFFDNVSIASLFHPFPNNPAWSYAKFSLDSTDTTHVYHLVSPVKVSAHTGIDYIQGGYHYNLSDVNAAPIEVTKTIDTLYKCKGSTIVLSAPPNQTPPYHWSNGDTAQSISVIDTGLYYVAYEIPQTCVDYLYFQDYTYIIDTQGTRQNPATYDTLVKCIGSVVVLQADSSISYLWSTGDTTRAISIADAGQYSVNKQISDTGCFKYFEMQEYAVQNNVQYVHTSRDTSVCPGDTIVLVSFRGAGTWSTGDTGTSTLVDKDGAYTVTTHDTCDNPIVDSIIVSNKFCPERYCNFLELPSAFTPNSDGRNDIFKVVKKGNIFSYSLAIYNRWGEKVFETDDINKGWDGNYKGVPAEIGTYMYLCRVSCPDGTRQLKGDVTLVR